MPVEYASAPPKKPTAAQRTSAKKRDAYEEAIGGFGQIGQALCLGFKQYADAATIGQHWPHVSREVANLAENDPMIARIIDPLLKVGPYTALFAAVLPMATQIMVNHRLAPAGIAGTLPPELLESQMKLAMQQQQMELQREQKRMEEEIRDYANENIA